MDSSSPRKSTVCSAHLNPTRGAVEGCPNQEAAVRSQDFSFVAMGWSWETCLDVDAGGMAPCRFGEVCWRPLCPHRHSGKGRTARWAAVWALWAGEEEELVEVIKDTCEECFSERIHGADRRNRSPA